MGSPDRPKFRGPQDLRLEVRRSGKPESMDPRKRTYHRLVTTLVESEMMLEGCHGNSMLPGFQQATESIATVRDEARGFGFVYDLMAQEARRRIDEMKAEVDMEEPRGDAPPLSDADGFSYGVQRRRGW